MPVQSSDPEYEKGGGVDGSGILPAWSASALLDRADASTREDIAAGSGGDHHFSKSAASAALDLDGSATPLCFEPASHLLSWGGATPPRGGGDGSIDTAATNLRRFAPGAPVRYGDIVCVRIDVVEEVALAESPEIDDDDEVDESVATDENVNVNEGPAAANDVRASRSHALFLVAHRDGRVEWVQWDAAVAMAYPDVATAEAVVSGDKSALPPLPSGSATFLVVGGRAGALVRLTRSWGVTDALAFARAAGDIDDNNATSSQHGGHHQQQQQQQQQQQRKTVAGGIDEVSSSDTVSDEEEVEADDAAAATATSAQMTSPRHRLASARARAPTTFGLLPTAFADRLIEAPPVANAALFASVGGVVSQCRIPGLAPSAFVRQVNNVHGGAAAPSSALAEDNDDEDNDDVIIPNSRGGAANKSKIPNKTQQAAAATATAAPRVMSAMQRRRLAGRIAGGGGGAAAAAAAAAAFSAQDAALVPLPRTPIPRSLRGGGEGALSLGAASDDIIITAISGSSRIFGGGSPTPSSSSSILSSQQSNNNLSPRSPLSSAEKRVSSLSGYARALPFPTLLPASCALVATPLTSQTLPRRVLAARLAFDGPTRVISVTAAAPRGGGGGGGGVRRGCVQLLSTNLQRPYLLMLLQLLPRHTLHSHSLLLLSHLSIVQKKFCLLHSTQSKVPCRLLPLMSLLTFPCMTLLLIICFLVQLILLFLHAYHLLLPNHHFFCLLRLSY